MINRINSELLPSFSAVACSIKSVAHSPRSILALLSLSLLGIDKSFVRSLHVDFLFFSNDFLIVRDCNLFIENQNDSLCYTREKKTSQSNFKAKNCSRKTHRQLRFFSRMIWVEVVVVEPLPARTTESIQLSDASVRTGERQTSLTCTDHRWIALLLVAVQRRRGLNTSSTNQISSEKSESNENDQQKGHD